MNYFVFRLILSLCIVSTININAVTPTPAQTKAKKENNNITLVQLALSLAWSSIPTVELEYQHTEMPNERVIECCFKSTPSSKSNTTAENSSNAQATSTPSITTAN